MVALKSPERTAQAGAAAPAVERLDIFLTAAEAYPALEKAFLNAEREIIAGFRVFDLRTKLHSPEALKIGRDWFDLVVHTLNRGVSLHFIVSDFDPIGAPDLHCRCWRARRQMVAAGELASAGRITASMQLHDAKLGMAPRLLFFPMARKRLSDLVTRLNGMDLPRRLRYLEEAVRLKAVTDQSGDRVRIRNVLPHLFPASHHQKLAVIDRRLLYIGGLDVNDRRYDSPSHDLPAEKTWYDVQVMAEGPVVEAAHRHLSTFLGAVACREDPAPATPGFLRTLSCARPGNLLMMTPRPILQEIEEAHLRLTRQSRQLVYLETQFLRHIPLARALARRARACPDLRLMVVLPAAPETAAFSSNPSSDTRYGEYLQWRCLRILRKAFGADRLLVAAPVQPRPRDSEGRETLEGAPLVYVHAKVSIFDGETAIVSSANLNGRSMRWDTEAGLELTDPAQVAALENRVMAHWYGEDGADLEEMTEAERFAAWQARVAENTDAAPQDRKGFLVAYDSEPAREAALPLPGVPEELV